MKKGLLFAVFCILCVPVHADDTKESIKKATPSTQTLSAESRSSKALLLPAVQSVREGPYTPTRPSSSDARTPAKKATPSTQTLSAESRSSKALLLPAVQSVRERSAAPTGPSSLVRTPATGEAADTTCNGVASCNDMIATCIALGGSSTATSYDPDTGAPNGATCFPSAN